MGRLTLSVIARRPDFDELMKKIDLKSKVPIYQQVDKIDYDNLRPSEMVWSEKFEMYFDSQSIKDKFEKQHFNRGR